MRFNVDRICELAGLDAKSGKLMTEVAAAPAPQNKDSFVKVSEDDMGDDDSDMFGDDTVLSEEDLEEYMWSSPTEVGVDLDDDAMYDIDETELMEALVDMRQQRLEENQVRDAVRDEIQRALSDKSSSWMYGSNKPTASRQGQIARGGFGFGFGFKR